MTFIRPRKIMHHFAGLIVINNRAHRNLQGDALAFRPGAVGAFAMTPALCLVLRIKSEMHQRVVALAGFHDHVPATSAIAAAGSSARYKLFPAERHAAIAARSGGNANSCFIDEHG